MNDYGRPFEVACVPGPRATATAGMTRSEDGAPLLMVFLDPVTLSIRGVPTQEGWREMADFCRELAHEASRLAAAIDPDGEAAPPEAHAPRHALVRNSFGDSGGGH